MFRTRCDFALTFLSSDFRLPSSPPWKLFLILTAVETNFTPLSLAGLKTRLTPESYRKSRLIPLITGSANQDVFRLLPLAGNVTVLRDTPPPPSEVAEQCHNTSMKITTATRPVKPVSTSSTIIVNSTSPLSLDKGQRLVLSIFNTLDSLSLLASPSSPSLPHHSYVLVPTTPYLLQ
ncbi:hypothetical protein H2248_001059 [Termitomyces sp. 'cryptogamus']|nr:hypothetical protein H2248_001059 [Termitomyces sp. 'cryptogamus']